MRIEDCPIPRGKKGCCHTCGDCHLMEHSPETIKIVLEARINKRENITLPKDISKEV